MGGSEPKACMQLLKNQLSVFTLKAGSMRPTKQPLSYLLSPKWLTLGWIPQAFTGCKFPPLTTEEFFPINQAPHFWPVIVILRCWFLGDSSSQPLQTWDSKFPWTRREPSTLMWSQGQSQHGFTCPEISSCLHLFTITILLPLIVLQSQCLILTFTCLDFQTHQGKFRIRLWMGSARALVTRVGSGDGSSLLRHLCYTQI